MNFAVLTDKQKTRNLGLNSSFAYFSALNSVARFRINWSYFERSPREISGPWTSWRKISLSKSYKSKSGRVLDALSASARLLCLSWPPFLHPLGEGIRPGDFKDLSQLKIL